MSSSKKHTYSSWNDQQDAILFRCYIAKAEAAGIKVTGKDIADIWPKDNPMQPNSRGFDYRLSTIKKQATGETSAGPKTPKTPKASNAEKTSKKKAATPSRKRKAPAESESGSEIEVRVPKKRAVRSNEIVDDEDEIVSPGVKGEPEESEEE